MRRNFVLESNIRTQMGCQGAAHVKTQSVRHLRDFRHQRKGKIEISRENIYDKPSEPGGGERVRFITGNPRSAGEEI